MMMRMRNIRSVCAKVITGCSRRSYTAPRRVGISEDKVTFWTPPSLGSLLTPFVFGYLSYRLKATLEEDRLRKHLSEKRKHTRILSREYKSKLKQVEEAETKLIERAAIVVNKLKS